VPRSRQRSVITAEHVSIHRFMSRRLCPDHGLCGSNSRKPDRGITSDLPTIRKLATLLYAVPL